MSKRNLLIYPLLLVCYEILIYLSNDAYLPALPQIAVDLATTQHATQLSLTSWFLGASSMQLILGPLTDRFGRRPILLLGGIGFVISSWICGLANDIHVLIWARFVEGAAIPSMIIAGYATIHELLDEKQAIRTLAWMGSITIIAPTLGPLLGALVLVGFSWRWIFYFLTIFAAPILFLLYFIMPETSKDRHLHPLHLRAIAHKYYRILKNKTFMRPLLSYCLLFACVITWLVTGPFLIITQFEQKPIMFGIYQILIFGSYVVGTHLVKILHNKNTYHLMTIGILIAFTGGLLAFIGGVFWPQVLQILIIAMMLLSVGCGLSFPILNRTVIEASQEPMGARMAILSAMISGFGMLGSAAMSRFFNGQIITMAKMLILFTLIAALLHITNKNLRLHKKA